MISELVSDEVTNTKSDVEAATGTSTDYVPALTGRYVGTVAGGEVPSDSFFETANYKGAVPSDNDWTAGWTL